MAASNSYGTRMSKSGNPNRGNGSRRWRSRAEKRRLWMKGGVAVLARWWCRRMRHPSQRASRGTEEEVTVRENGGRKGRGGSSQLSRIKVTFFKLTTTLQEIHDVFPKKLPSSLPPDWCVVHRIQITLGAQPPRNITYIMSPAKLDDLRS